MRRWLTCLLLIAACKDTTKTTEPVPDASAPPPASVPAPAPSAVPPATSASSLAAENGVLTLAWRATNAANAHVAVSVVTAGQTIALGELDATADSEPSGTVESCAMQKGVATSSEFVCGGTPAYNFFTAKLAGGALVITRTTGVDGDPSSEKVVEVARRPTSATTLKSTGPASKGLWGNCRPGYVQRKEDSPCLRQCLKGNECKATDKCELIAVKGTDGDHKVHACVSKP